MTKVFRAFCRLKSFVFHCKTCPPLLLELSKWVCIIYIKFFLTECARIEPQSARLEGERLNHLVNSPFYLQKALKVFNVLIMTKILLVPETLAEGY